MRLSAVVAAVLFVEQLSGAHLADLGFGDLRHVQVEGVPQTF